LSNPPIQFSPFPKEILTVLSGLDVTKHILSFSSVDSHESKLELSSTNCVSISHKFLFKASFSVVAIPILHFPPEA
jgi:hypothetical protein